MAMRAKSSGLAPRIGRPLDPCIARRYSQVAPLLRPIGEPVCSVGNREGWKKGGPVGSRAEPTGPRRARRPADALVSDGSLPPIMVDKHDDPISLSVPRRRRPVGLTTIRVSARRRKPSSMPATGSLSCDDVVRLYRCGAGGDPMGSRRVSAPHPSATRAGTRARRPRVRQPSSKLCARRGRGAGRPTAERRSARLLATNRRPAGRADAAPMGPILAPLTASPGHPASPLLANAESLVTCMDLPPS